MMRKSIGIVLIAVLHMTLYGQNSHYKGKVVDARYKTPVPYAVVFVEHTQIGTVANNVGEFSFSVPDSLKNSRLASVGEGYRLTYLVPEGYDHIALPIALEPQEQVAESPVGGGAVKPGNSGRC